MYKITRLIFFLFLMTVIAYPIMITDSLSRGKFYQVKFKMTGEKSTSRYVGLYTQKTLDADLFIYDENDKLLGKFSGTAGKYPSEFMFPGNGIYSAKVVAFSGDGPFLMLISDRDELKKILKDVK
ncbi:MAG: hypothetical protein PHV30_09380 [Candidatus Margulisbacteria bacterium]|nr:hypothetical protein [Candidatus Margulisiibacteriota bacterium]